MHPSNAHQTLAEPTDVSPARCLYLYCYRHCRIHLSVTELVTFQPLLPLRCSWWKMKSWILCVVNTGLECWHFLTELAIFKLSEASGCLCFMDYISVSYGLDTSLANCVKLGEAAGQWAQPVRNLSRGSIGAARYVRNEESSRWGDERSQVLHVTAYSEALGGSH